VCGCVEVPLRRSEGSEENEENTWIPDKVSRNRSTVEGIHHEPTLEMEYPFSLNGGIHQVEIVRALRADLTVLLYGANYDEFTELR
jgi:hypothetical protein